MRIVYLGTPAFSASALQYLLNNDVPIVGVVTRIDKPKGRSSIPTPPPVKELVLNAAPTIPILQPKSAADPEFFEQLKALNPDLIVCVAYGAIIKEHILSLPKHGCINLHTSLLPQYRGAAPIQRCIMAGEKKTGVTIMKMVKDLDAGDIIATKEIAIDDTISGGELELQLCSIGAGLMLQVIRTFEKGEPLRYTPQDHSQATYAAKILPADCQFSWDRPAKDIHNIIRGLSPSPGAWCTITLGRKEKRLRILRTALSSIPSTSSGEIVYSDKQNLTISCADGTLDILEIQLEGKKIMNIDEFLRGCPTHALSFLV